MMVPGLLLAATVHVTAAANLAVPEAQVGFAPYIYFQDWQSVQAAGDHELEPDGSRAFAIPCDHVGAEPLDGKAVFASSDGAVRADYEVKGREDVDCYYVALVGNAPMDVFAGGALVRDGEAVEIPKVFDAARGGWEQAVRNLTFRDSAGKDVFSIGFDEPVRVCVHDGRKWNWDILQVRLLFDPHGTVSSTSPSRLSFRVSSADGMTLENSGPWTAAADKDWVPVDFRPGVAPGSALDFSGLRPNASAKAGAFGRIVARDEHFEFEDLPGVEQRFYGINLCRDTCCPEERAVPALIDELARTGYNAVRVHHHENALVRPYTPELDPEKMRRFDALVAACVERGIYLTTDLFVSRMVPYVDIGIASANAFVPTEDFKHLVFFHEGAYSNYLAFARNFLGHRNAFTGRTLAEEPALGWISLVNEGNLGNNGMDVFRRYPVIGERWRAWLAQKRIDAPDLYQDVSDEIPGDLAGGTPASQAFVVFLAETERDFARRTTAFLREEMKCRALVANMNSWTYPAAYQVPRADEYDYVDDHTYIDHPRFPIAYGQLPSELDNGNPVRNGTRGIFGFASRRIFGRPFTVTEYNFCGPSAWRGTSGLLAGAQAALQGWAGLWRFDWADQASVLTDRESRGATCYFDICGDPMNLAAERAAVALFLRHDMRPLGEENPLTFGRLELTTPTAEVAGSVTGLALSQGWNTRLGTRLVAEGPRTDPLPGADPDGQAAGLGQVAVDGRKGVFAVQTERTCGFLSEGGRMCAGALTADLGETPASMWVSALDDRPIAAANRLLVAHLTDCQDTGITFSDSLRRNILLSGGTSPRLMRVGRAEVFLSVGKGVFAVHALASDGTRRAQVTSQVVNGELRFEARTDLLPGACWLYEVERILDGDRSASAELPSGVAFHVDAAKQSTMELQAENGTNFVTRWSDASGGEIVAFFRDHGVYGGNRRNRRPFLRTEALSGLPVVDFGTPQRTITWDWSAGYGGSLDWNAALEGVREVFMVVADVRGGSGDSAAYLTSVADGGARYYPFIRGDDGAICNQELPAEACRRVRDGLVRIDGGTVASSTQVPEGFHLIHFRTTDAVRADSFCSDRTYVEGGLQIGEAIVYERTLSDDEAALVETYLRTKWFMALEGDAVEVPVGMTMTVQDLNADAEGVIAKAGGGTLVAAVLGETPGTVDVRGGALRLASGAKPMGAFFHVDASATGTYETFERDGRTYVSVVRDASGGTVTAAPRQGKTGVIANPSPYIDRSYLGGKPVFNFGTMWSAENPSGEGGNLCWDRVAPDVREVFMVVADHPTIGSAETPNGQFFLGTHSVNTCGPGMYDNWHPFWRGAGTQLFHYNNRYNPDGYLVNYGLIQVDGRPAGIADGYPPGFHILHVRPLTDESAAVSVNAFACEREYNMGGQMIAEALVFSGEALSEADARKTYDYLHAKWFKPGPSAAYAFKTVAVAEGATFDLGSQDVRTAALAGGGTVVTPCLALDDGAVWTVPLSGTPLASCATTVEGTLALGKTGVVRLEVRENADAIPGGTYVVARAKAYEGLANLAGWTVEANGKLPEGYSATLAVKDWEIVVMVERMGTVIILR